MSDPWLVVIDPQRVFADPESPWGSPMFGAVVDPIRRLATEFGTDRTVLTRWLPATDPAGSWRAYFDRWPFANKPAEDPMFDLVAQLTELRSSARVDAPTFGKWPALESVTGTVPELVLTGVATDCCVLSTALAAADAGATVRVVGAACAGSTTENHRRALDVMALYGPQIIIEQ